VKEGLPREGRVVPLSWSPSLGSPCSPRYGPMSRQQEENAA